MTLLQKKTTALNFFILIATVFGCTQDFLFTIYFEDNLGNIDSLELGYDEMGNLGIDEIFEEENIIDIPRNNIFDVRVTDELYQRSMGESSGTYHSKREILGFWWSEMIASIDIKSENFPITASWDSTFFADDTNINGTLITSVPPGGWWDVGSYSDMGRIELKDQSSVTFTSNIPYSGYINNNYAYTQGNDTISVFWFTFGPEGIGVNTDNVEKGNEVIILYPNPVQDDLRIINRSPYGKISQTRIYDLCGRLVYAGIFEDDFVSVEHLDSGLYLIEFIMDRGKRIVKKLIKK